MQPKPSIYSEPPPEKAAANSNKPRLRRHERKLFLLKQINYSSGCEGQY